jgi:AbrB family looped-hinge helix DNA binding protein
MTPLELHHDGRLALPAGLRRKLGLRSGHRLETELIGGTVVVRPATAVRHRAEPKTQASEPFVATILAVPPAEATTLRKRKPSRSRKVRVAEEPELAGFDPT